MLARVFAIPFDEKRLVLEALVRLVWARIEMSISAPSLILARRTGNGDERHAPRVIGLSIERAAKLIPGTTCLPKALAVAGMLRSRGYDCELRLGLKKEAGRVAAHAWVEVDGEVILGGSCNISDFKKLPTISREQEHSHAG
jgi:hypothetical protein